MIVCFAERESTNHITWKHTHIIYDGYKEKEMTQWLWRSNYFLLLQFFDALRLVLVCGFGWLCGGEARVFFGLCTRSTRRTAIFYIQCNRAHTFKRYQGTVNECLLERTHYVQQQVVSEISFLFLNFQQS